MPTRIGQLNGNGQKGMLQIDAPPSKISGYATGRATVKMCGRPRKTIFFIDPLVPYLKKSVELHPKMN